MTQRIHGFYDYRPLRAQCEQIPFEICARRFIPVKRLKLIIFNVNGKSMLESTSWGSLAGPAPKLITFLSPWQDIMLQLSGRSWWTMQSRLSRIAKSRIQTAIVITISSFVGGLSRQQFRIRTIICYSQFVFQWFPRDIHREKERQRERGRGREDSSRVKRDWQHMIIYVCFGLIRRAIYRVSWNRFCHCWHKVYNTLQNVRSWEFDELSLSLLDKVKDVWKFSSTRISGRDDFWKALNSILPIKRSGKDQDYWCFLKRETFDAFTSSFVLLCNYTWWAN